MKKLLLAIIITVILSSNLIFGVEETSSSLSLINKEEYTYKAANPDIEDLLAISSLLGITREDLIKAHIDENKTGAYESEDFKVQVIVINDSIVSFTSNLQVQFVFIKGGNQGGNLYLYTPSVLEGNDLTTPNNTSNAKPADLSHLVFYYYKETNEPEKPEDPIIIDDPISVDQITEEPEEPNDPTPPEEPEIPVVIEEPQPNPEPPTIISEPQPIPVPIIDPVPVDEELIIEEKFPIPEEILDETPQEEEEEFLTEEIPEEAPLELPNAGGLPQTLIFILGFFSLAAGLIFKINK